MDNAEKHLSEINKTLKGIHKILYNKHYDSHYGGPPIGFPREVASYIQKGNLEISKGKALLEVSKRLFENRKLWGSRQEDL